MISLFSLFSSVQELLSVPNFSLDKLKVFHFTRTLTKAVVAYTMCTD